jgi:ribosomal protein S18 acetylase RimI-like enzyme
MVMRPATRQELKQVANWLLEGRGQDEQIRKVAGSGLRRALFKQVLIPRYLRQATTTWMLEQDGALAGYAVVEQRGVAVHLADLAVFQGFDRAAWVPEVLRHAEEFALERDYRFVRTSLVEADDAASAPYLRAGYQFLDYYLWAYDGRVLVSQPPGDVTLREIPPQQALDRRLHYLRQELDASEVSGRQLIDSSYLPSRPPRQRAFEIVLAASEGDKAERPIGYLLGRPNARGDGVLTMVLSMDPAFWGSDVEARIVASVASEAQANNAFRLLLSTTRHCEQADDVLASIGLHRQLDRYPVLFKALI